MTNPLQPDPTEPESPQEKDPVFPIQARSWLGWESTNPNQQSVEKYGPGGPLKPEVGLSGVPTNPNQQPVEGSGLQPLRVPTRAAPTDRSALRAHTPARVALRSAGTSLATTEILDLNLCLAEARDAIHARLSPASLLPQLAARQWDPILLSSAARDRREYLRRPDLGRRLSDDSRTLLEQNSASHLPHPLIVVIADGLSALAAERHAIPLLDALAPCLAESGASIGPIVIVEQARVAIGDEIGEQLHAQMLLMLIGERPGLSSPDSMGAYLTWQPRAGRTDAERNCISNIRPEGLSYKTAAAKIAYYLKTAQARQLTGVDLKEESPQLPTSSNPKLP